MSASGLSNATAGLIAILAGIVVALAKVIEIAISRVVPRKQVLSDDEYQKLSRVEQITTARDEDGVPLAWFPAYARKQNTEIVDVMRDVAKGVDQLVLLTDQTKELLRKHAQELEQFIHETS